MKTTRRAARLAVSALFVCLFSVPATAQQVVLSGAPSANVAVRNFQPSASPSALFATEGAEGAGHLQVAGGAVFHFATNTLKLDSPELGETVLIENRLTADTLLSFGLWNWLELDLAVPVFLVNTASVVDTDLSGTALGDVSLGAKATLLDTDAPVGLAVFGGITAPTGAANAFATRDVWAGSAGVILERELGIGVGATARAGALLQPETTLADSRIGHAVTYAVGLRKGFDDNAIELGGELVGSASLDGESTPLEGVLGVRLHSQTGLALELGGGTGLLRGVGSPDLRVFAGVRYASLDRRQVMEETLDDLFSPVPYVPTQEEWDALGDDAVAPLRKMAQGKMRMQTVVDQRRAISALSNYPTDQNKQVLFELLEDKQVDPLTRRKIMLSLATGWGARRTPDGCAQRRNDLDVITRLSTWLDHDTEQERESAVHAMRQTRTMPGRAKLEQRRQSEQSTYLLAEIDRALASMHFAPNGCIDRDQDDIEDVLDVCPDETEDADGFEDDDGCPEFDNDGDGIDDNFDGCPNVAGVAWRQGCLDADDDNDGLLETDKCPDAPEDKDGFEDDDGCPDLDNDKDGIPDASDKCPDEPETINGFQDADGCPDKGAVLVTANLKITERVYFKRGSADIRKRSFKLLDGVAQVLKGHPEILSVEIQGHTDDTGNAAANLALSKARAESVRDYLVSAGVAPERLTAGGYGAAQPAVPTKGLRGRALKKARDQNRRVRFVVRERKR